MTLDIDFKFNSRIKNGEDFSKLLKDISKSMSKLLEVKADEYAQVVIDEGASQRSETSVGVVTGRLRDSIFGDYSLKNDFTGTMFVGVKKGTFEEFYGDIQEEDKNWFTLNVPTDQEIASDYDDLLQQAINGVDV